YDKLPIILPGRDLAPADKNVALEFKAKLRNLLVKAGASEVLTYSFVPGRLLEAAGQDPREAYHIRNAVSPDLQYYRLSLVPSLLEKIHPNQKNGFDAFALFEIGLGHVKGFVDDKKLPIETESLALAVMNPYASGAPYYQARALADFLFAELNIAERTYTPLDEEKIKIKSSWHKAFEPGRSAVVRSPEHVLGIIGEPTAKLRSALKLPPATSVFELDIPNLYESQLDQPYRPLNRFPSSIQDICLRLPVSVNYGQADQLVWHTLDKLANQAGYDYDMETLDIFQKPADKHSHQITWRISLRHPDKTLTTDEVNKLLAGLAQRAKQALKAERV
ncbi:MAG TPA: hypothetical protein VFK97_02915, partial [Candidatus Saccharimonadales bacterium]|nr:hypothetical protein [Candidatus Saccharimonadales bacterium]